MVHRHLVSNCVSLLISELMPIPRPPTCLCKIVNKIFNILYYLVSLFVKVSSMFMPIFTSICQLERKIFVLSQKFPNNSRIFLVQNKCRTFSLFKCMLKMFFNLHEKLQEKVNILYFGRKCVKNCVIQVYKKEILSCIKPTGI